MIMMTQTILNFLFDFSFFHCSNQASITSVKNKIF